MVDPLSLSPHLAGSLDAPLKGLAPLDLALTLPAFLPIMVSTASHSLRPFLRPQLISSSVLFSLSGFICLSLSLPTHRH
jgi:hypothetical protein